MLNPKVSQSVSIPNYPELGDTIKAESIRAVNAINKMKKLPAPSRRNFEIFASGIYTAYRTSELLSIRLGQVSHLKPGDRLEVKQKKEKKYRAVTLKNGCVEAIQALLEHLDRKALQFKDLTWIDDDSYLFAGNNSRKPLTVMVTGAERKNSQIPRESRCRRVAVSA